MSPLRNRTPDDLEGRRNFSHRLRARVESRIQQGSRRPDRRRWMPSEFRDRSRLPTRRGDSLHRANPQTTHLELAQVEPALPAGPNRLESESKTQNVAQKWLSEIILVRKHDG